MPDRMHAGTGPARPVRARIPAARRMRAAAGFALLEALIAFLIGGFGMLAIARLQMTMIGESDFAKQLSEATFLGQRQIERLRSFQQSATADATMLAAGGWGYGNVASGVSTVAGTNATYTVRWTVTPSTTPTMKTATVDVGWTDSRGAAQTSTLHTIIAGAEPSMSSGLTVPPVGTPIKRPKNRDLNVPVPAVDLGNGTSWFTPPGAASTVRIVFDNTTGVITKRCTGASSDPATWACTNLTAYLVSGFISVDNRSSLTLTSPIDVTLTMTEGTLDSCYDDSALGTKTYANRITYTCIVVGNDHDSDSTTPSRWSGRSTLGGFTAGLTSALNRVCRYSYDYDGSGNIDNYEHPNNYSGVTHSLENQNFIVMKGNDSCPGSGIDVTVLHQP